jgi:N-acetylglucosamine-6-sulfatase
MRRSTYLLLLVGGAGFVVLLVFAILSATESPAAASTKPTKPNIIFILTDDQDFQMDSLNYMQGVKTHLTDQGTFFEHHYCTVALCCPSRVNMWSGKAAHNTNVTDLNPPYGMTFSLRNFLGM